MLSSNRELTVNKVWEKGSPRRGEETRTTVQNYKQGGYSLKRRSSHNPMVLPNPILIHLR